MSGDTTITREKIFACICTFAKATCEQKHALKNRSAKDAHPKQLFAAVPCGQLMNEYRSNKITALLRGLRKSSGGTGIMVPVKKVPQERKIQES